MEALRRHSYTPEIHIGIQQPTTSCQWQSDTSGHTHVSLLWASDHTIWALSSERRPGRDRRDQNLLVNSGSQPRATNDAEDTRGPSPTRRAGWANRLTLTTKARQGPLLPPDIKTLPSTDPPGKAQSLGPDSNQSRKFSPTSAPRLPSRGFLGRLRQVDRQRFARARYQLSSPLKSTSDLDATSMRLDYVY
jgi:hypothetical protein